MAIPRLDSHRVGHNDGGRRKRPAIRCECSLREPDRANNLVQRDPSDWLDWGFRGLDSSEIREIWKGVGPQTKLPELFSEPRHRGLAANSTASAVILREKAIGAACQGKDNDLHIAMNRPGIGYEMSWM